MQKQQAVSKSVIDNIGKKAAETKANNSAIGPGPVRRILKELEQISNDMTEVKVFCNEDDISFWKVALKGPDDSVYEGRWWAVTVRFPSDYPMKPPKVNFQTVIYHCNVSAEGNLCLDILKDSWSPALTILSVFRSIISLLITPNPDDPLSSEKAALYRDNLPEYKRRAREFANTVAFQSLEDLMKAFNLE